MPQNTAIRTTGRPWDFLEPAIDPSSARTMHSKIVASATDTEVAYPAGQVIRQKNDGTNEWAKQGTSGYDGPARLIKYPIIVDDNGYWQYGDEWYAQGEIFEGSIAAYYQGKFKCQDITGIAGAGGVAEVQTETLTATGGTRTLTITNPITGVSATTAAIAYNADAATIQAAIDALANVDAGDIVVGGTGPFTYTAAGNFLGQDLAPIVVGTGSLTGGSSSMAQTTAGESNLDEIGRLISGTINAGIFELGGAVLATT